MCVFGFLMGSNNDSTKNINDTNAKIDIDKQHYRQKKKSILSWLSNWDNIQNKLREQYNTNLDKQCESYNMTCPSCGSHSVVHRFIKNDSYVNHCKSCDQEWVVKKPADFFNTCKIMYYSAYELQLLVFNFIRHVYLSLYNFYWDPADITSDYDTKEEAWQGAINNIKENYDYVINNIPLAVIHYIARNEYNNKCGYSDVMKKQFNHIFEPCDIESNIIGRFTKKFEDILCNTLNINKYYDGEIKNCCIK